MFDSTHHLEDSIPESRQTAAKEIKSPLRGFKWLSRRCAALNRASHGVGLMWEGRAPSRPFRERRCCAYADLAKADGTTTPGIPGYATIGLCQDAGGSRLSRPGESGGCPRARSTRTALGAWHCGVAGVWPRGNATLPYRTPLEPTPPLSPPFPLFLPQNTQNGLRPSQNTQKKVVGRIGAWHSVCSVCREAASVYSAVKRRGGVRTSRANI